MYLKIAVSIVIASLLIGCNAVRIKDAQRQLVHPGVPTGTPGISYYWIIQVHKSIEIKSITLQAEEDKLDIVEYSITELPSGKILPKNSKLTNANYFVSISIKDESRIHLENEVVILQYQTLSGLKTLRFKPKTIESLFMK